MTYTSTNIAFEKYSYEDTRRTTITDVHSSTTLFVVSCKQERPRNVYGHHSVLNVSSINNQEQKSKKQKEEEDNKRPIEITKEKSKSVHTTCIQIGTNSKNVFSQWYQEQRN